MKLLRIALAGAGMLLVAGGLWACAPREIPFAELRLEYGLPASRTFEPSPGVKVHYTDEGRRDGRVIVLVHGFAASVHAWRPWTERLSDTYRVVSIDLPGHGLTETPQGYRASLEGNAQLVDALATHLSLERFILAGNSMGGAVSLSYAMTHPEKLDGLVLVCAAGWPGNGEARGGPPGAFALLGNDVGRFFLKLVNPRLVVPDGLRSAYHDTTLVTETVIDRYTDLAMAEGHRDVLLTQRSQPEPPWTPQTFSRISTPTLVMVGEQDALIPPANSRALAEAIPGAYLVAYPEGGHLPMEQLPDETVQHLETFLRGLPAR
jgi:pimeloyl-ACP methyl ester carboxylesterase